MRVVQLLPELNEGGVERGVVELNREFVKRGIESIVISAGGKQAPQIEADGGRHITFDVVSKNPLTALPRALQLHKLLRQLQPDILHARSRVPAWLAYMANKQLKIPFVTTVHGFNSVNAYSRVMTFGDRVICVSNSIREHVTKSYQVPEEKLVVIPRGVDLELFNPQRVDDNFIHAFRERNHLHGKYVVTAVGRITQLKDYETFIRAIAMVRQQQKDLCGLIVGGVRHDKQDYFNALKTLADELQLQDALVFAGSQSKMTEIYTLSDLVVSCSKKPESFGRTAAEALAMNVPVIATNHGGVVDIVKEGQSGMLVQVQEPAQLAAAISRCRQTSFEGLRAQVEALFSLSGMVDKTHQVYLELLQRNS